jgi:CheY-like chemotaxis protein
MPIAPPSIAPFYNVAPVEHVSSAGIAMTAHSVSGNRLPTILLIDDEADLLIAWALLLELEGFHVVTATSGRDGLDIARQLQPALIVTDLMMPGIDGAQVCRFVRADPELSAVPVILWTASIDIPAGTSCDRVLHKPVARDTMLRHIRALLRVRGA